MKPGERVTTITKIAAALGERNWSEVDLTLEQFGMPISDSWSGDPYSYVVEHIKGASDENLLELHDFLFPGDASVPGSTRAHEEDAGGIWEPGYFRLFIAHSSLQTLEVGELKVALRDYGIDGFVAHADIEPTQEWRDVIEVALRTCEAFAAYLTPDFHPSMWTDQEIGVALARGILVIPIRKGATPYGFMGKYQALPGANKGAARLAQDIAGIVAQHALTTKRYTAARESVVAGRAVEAFENAQSFNAARATFTTLRGISWRALTPDLLNRVEHACDANGELKAQWAFGSTSVADEAKKLVALVRASSSSS
ncbi:MAG: toll/interleukin-1 receptor domain-containing protein [Gaiellaceae bacterium]|jgi:hypothetical protein